jgi:putative heme-binding domain-containing protein
MKRRLLRLLTLSLVMRLGPTVPPVENPPLAFAAWAASPLEVRVVFDRALTDEEAGRFVGTSITFEIAKRSDAPLEHGSLLVADAWTLDGGRTLVLATDPHPWSTAYQIDLSPFAADGAARPLTYHLSGVEAQWEAEDGESEKPSELVWWPALDLTQLETLASANRSPAHARSLARLAKPGRMMLRTLIAPAREARTFDLVVAGPLGIEEATVEGELAPYHMPAGTARHVIPPGEQSVEVVVDLKTGRASAEPPALRLIPSGGVEAVASGEFLLPWAPARPLPPREDAPPSPDVAGGVPARGEIVFFGPEGKCSDCHTFRGRGKQVGPDLSDIGKREPSWIHRAIVEPSAEIHPDYVPFTVALSDGRVVAGTVRSQGPSALRITDTGAKETVVERSLVTEIRPTATSIMPVGLAGVLGPEKLRDLIAYLRSPAEQGAEK